MEKDYDYVTSVVNSSLFMIRGITENSEYDIFENWNKCLHSISVDYSNLLIRKLSAKWIYVGRKFNELIFLDDSFVHFFE